MNTSHPPVSSGIEGLDHILNGGYPLGRIMLLEGAPGTGKTTLALHVLAAAAARGDKALFFSVAQSRPEIEMIANSHGLPLSGIDIQSPELGEAEGERVFSVDSEEAELVALLGEVNAHIETSKPDVFVFDSLLELRLLAPNLTTYRRELLTLRRQLRNHETTAILIDHLEPEGGERNAEGIVHGVIRLEALTPSIGNTHRRLTVTKLRGRGYMEGWHDFRIRTGGITVYPRIIPHKARAVDIEETLEPPSEPLKQLLGGGLEFGTTVLIYGQSGTGKSSLATLLARAAADRGLKASMFLFEERPEVLLARSAGVGLDIFDHVEDGAIGLFHFDPAEVSPGEFSSTVIRALEEGTRVVVIDSLTGYLNALPERSQIMTHMQTLLQYLARRKALVIVTMSQQGLLGEEVRTSVDASFLADSVILLRQYEASSEIRRSIAVLKKRHSEHKRTIEEFIIRPGAVEVRSLSVGEQNRAKGASPLGPS